MALRPGSTQVRAIDAERTLAERFGFTPAELAQVSSGKSVARLLPSKESDEIGVLAAVKINAKADRLVYWFHEIASFRKAAELGLSRRISDTPQIGDFADLSLDADELAAVRKCRPGSCDLLLGDRAIERFQTSVDWKAGNAATRANLLMRELLLSHAQAYLKGGDQALGANHNDKAPRLRADDFHQLLQQSTELYGVTPALTAYLEGFPSARLPESQQFLYWGKGGAGPDASISLHQLVIYQPTGGNAFIADKQLYASRYVDAALTVVSLAPASNGQGFYAIVGGRARSSMLGGMGARLLRGKVEKATRETAAMYLDWIKASLNAG
jgi:hypothetical protein